MGENTISDAKLSEIDTSLDENIRSVDVAITSAEVLALNAAPKLLVPPPGAGKALELLSALLILDFNSAAYATNGTLQLQTVTGNTALSDLVTLANFLAATADQATIVQALSAETVLDINDGLELFMPTAETITGDSPIVCRVHYRIHDLGL